MSHSSSAMESSGGGTPRNGGGAGLPERLLLLVSAPGRLGDHLRERPVWWDALLLGSLLAAAANYLVPPEVWEDFARAQMLRSGAAMPEGVPPGTGQRIRLFGSLAAPIVWGLFLTISAGIMAFVFAFVLGDEGRFRQYFAGTAHATLLTASGGVLVSPLRAARGDPQLTLSVGTFLQGALEGSYAGAFLNALDLFGLWSWIVMGILYSRLDARRSPGSAIGVVVGVSLAVVAVLAWFQARAVG